MVRWLWRPAYWWTMQAVVLESFVGSEYEDSPSSYEFPSRYLRFFEPLSRGEPMVAVIYEPRGDGSGRMAYVGWAMLARPPAMSTRNRAAGSRLWVVEYIGRYREFDRVVPRTVGGQPIESWLRAIPAGRPRNVATFGRAVRGLTAGDLETIFRFGFAHELDTVDPYPVPDAHEAPHALVQERARRLVATAQREARFRDDVLLAYDHACAVTGFSIGRVSPARLHGLVDAAHIRPVWDKGADGVANGLALTPTLHRFFDRGLFTASYQDGRPVIVVSPRLDHVMVASPDGRSRLSLNNGDLLKLPTDRRSWPHPDALAYHERRVFLSSRP